jgi:hypothetical protein
MKIMSLVGCVSLRRSLDWMIGFIDTTWNYRQLQHRPWFTHFTLHGYTRTSALILHKSYRGNGFTTVSLQHTRGLFPQPNSFLAISSQSFDCHLQRLSQFWQLLHYQAHILTGWCLETQLTQIIFFVFLKPLGTDRTENTASVWLRCVSMPLHSNGRGADHTEITALLFRGNVFTQLFHSDGCTRHISHRDYFSVVACEHYLATAVSLAPQFLLWANTPQ